MDSEAAQQHLSRGLRGVLGGLSSLGQISVDLSTSSITLPLPQLLVEAASTAGAEAGDQVEAGGGVGSSAAAKTVPGQASNLSLPCKVLNGRHITVPLGQLWATLAEWEEVRWRGAMAAICAVPGASGAAPTAPDAHPAGGEVATMGRCGGIIACGLL